MIYSIRTRGSSSLRQRCKPVTVFDEKLAMLGADLVDTCKHHSALGVAANQCGILLAVIVVERGDEDFPLVMCNPVITYTSGTNYRIEQCLSLPDVAVRVRRADYIEVNYDTILGMPLTLQARGLVSRTIQHEIDHLHGILITDHREET